MQKNRINSFFLIVFLSFSLIQNLMCMRDKRTKDKTKQETSQEYKKKKRSENIQDPVSKKILSDIVFNENLDDNVLCDKYIFLNIDGFKESFKKQLDLFRKNIIKLIDNKNFKKTISLQEKDIYDQRSIYYGRVIHAKKPVNIYFMGDIHGSTLHVIKNLRLLKHLCVLSNDLELKNLKTNDDEEKETIFACSGDIIDRGVNSAESLYLLMILFNKNPNKIILLRGNHEAFLTSHQYGFSMEIGKYFSNIENEQLNNCLNYFRDLYKNKNLNKDESELDSNKTTFQNIIKSYFENPEYKKIISTLKLLPSTAFIIPNNNLKIQLTHGAIDPKFILNNNIKTTAIELEKNKTFINDNLNKYIWGDIILQEDTLVKRGSVETISEKNTNEYMKKNNIDFLLCGHNHYSKNLDKYGFMYSYNEKNKKTIIRHIQYYGEYKYLPSLINISIDKEIDIKPIYMETQPDLNIPANSFPDFLRKNFNIDFLWWLKKQN